MILSVHPGLIFRSGEISARLTSFRTYQLTIYTALAFFLWNHALETLEAFELSVLQNTMLIQITLLSFFFLGETLHPVKYIYLAWVFIGVYVVQSKRGPGVV